MYDDLYFDRESELMSRAEIAELQEARILRLVPFVYERSPLIGALWRDAGVHPRDIRSVDDFRERVPTMSKNDVRAFRDSTGDSFGGVLCVEPRELSAILSTSGTTGDSTLFPERWPTWSRLASWHARFLWAIGLRPGDRVLCPGSTYRGPFYEMYQMIGAIPIMSDTAKGDWHEIFELARRFQPAAMKVSGPGLVALAALEDQFDIAEVLSSVKVAIFGGEPLSARMRQRLEDWKLEVVSTTSAADVGIAMECLERDGHHLWEDEVLLEVVDPDTGQQVADGEVGELVATGIDDVVAPLVRFGSGDLVRVSRETCACGRTHARLWPLGRRGDEVVVNGRAVLPMDIWAAIDSAPETAAGVFQLIKPARELDVLRVRVGYNAAVTSDVAELAERVAASILASVGVMPQLDMVDERTLLATSPAGKVRRVAPT
jgi:phenylacetate-CoA ligase